MMICWILFLFYAIHGQQGLIVRSKALESIISMALCKTAVTPLLTSWSYCSLALSQRFVFFVY